MSILHRRAAAHANAQIAAAVAAKPKRARPPKTSANHKGARRRK